MDTNDIPWRGTVLSTHRQPQTEQELTLPPNDAFDKSEKCPTKYSVCYTRIGSNSSTIIPLVVISCFFLNIVILLSLLCIYGKNVESLCVGVGVCVSDLFLQPREACQR